MGKPPCLVLADHERLVAEGIGRLLDEHFDEIDVVDDGRALLDVAVRRRPDLILTDISMPVVDGLEVTRRLRRSLPEVPVVILARHRGLAYARAALEAGARGYLTRAVTSQELLFAVDEVLAGNPYVTPSVASVLMTSILSPAPPADPSQSPLTSREQEIAERVAEGLETVEIAARLFIAEVTVRTHLRRILRKLGLRNRVELTRHVLRQEQEKQKTAKLTPHVNAAMTRAENRNIALIDPAGTAP